MANRLFSDLRDSAGRRYFYDLDSAPGVCLPGAATLSLSGHEVQYPGTVFRTPTPALLTLSGPAVGPSGTILSPATAALALSNSVIGLVTSLTIALTLPPPIENPPADFAPTILFINTITPAPAALSLVGYVNSLSEGGDIGFLSPPTAALSLFGYQYTRIIPPPPGEGLDGVQGTLFIAGTQPTVVTELVVSPTAGSLVVSPVTAHVDPGFVWVDDAPAPQIQWA